MPWHVPKGLADNGSTKRSVEVVTQFRLDFFTFCLLVAR